MALERSAKTFTNQKNIMSCRPRCHIMKRCLHDKSSHSDTWPPRSRNDATGMFLEVVLIADFAMCKVAPKSEWLILSSKKVPSVELTWLACNPSCSLGDTSSHHVFSSPSPASQPGEPVNRGSNAEKKTKK